MSAPKYIRLLHSDLPVARVARKMLNPPNMRPLLNTLPPFAPILMGWRLLHRSIYPADLNGIKFQFYDPRGPECYWRSFFYNTYMKGTLYEHSVVMHLKQISAQYDAPIFLDVGANYGYFTVYLAKLGGPSSKVISFEPNSQYFRILSRNVELNGLPNVALRRNALSDRKGMVILQRSQYFRTDERRKMTYSNEPSQESVLAVPFDEVAQKERISPDIVKIDVAGAEGNVIAGMKKSLKKVSHLYCELHRDIFNGYSARYIVTALQDSGMETFEFRGFRIQNGCLTDVPDDLFSEPGNRMIYARR